MELFAVGGASPESVWELVSDPWRVAEWTDADRVEAVEPAPLREGTVISIHHRGRTIDWRVVTLADRTIEVVADTPRGRLGLGVGVIAQQTGTRLVLVGVLRPSGSPLRARLVDIPRLRRRFDRWSRSALQLAGPQ